MYLGTKERTVWIKDPNTNSDYDVIGYLDTINYLNGGVGVRDSKNSHREYSYTWNVMSREMIGDLEGFSSGLYGDGLNYFLDPVAMDKNLFSAQWAAPKITAEDGIPLAGTVRPAKVLVGDTSLAYPLYGAQYSVTTSTPKREFYSPLPTGFTAWVGAHGTVAAKGLIVQISTRTANTWDGCSIRTLGSNSMPTETKKSTEKASRSGKDSSAARWLKSDSRITTPAKKAPKANDTSNSVEAA